MRSINSLYFNVSDSFGGKLFDWNEVGKKKPSDAIKMIWSEMKKEWKPYLIGSNGCWQTALVKDVLQPKETAKWFQDVHLRKSEFKVIQLFAQLQVRRSNVYIVHWKCFPTKLSNDLLFLNPMIITSPLLFVFSADFPFLWLNMFVKEENGNQSWMSFLRSFKCVHEQWDAQDAERCCIWDDVCVCVRNLISIAAGMALISSFTSNEMSP